MGHTVRVNFNRPVPLFPLPGTVLLPHAVQQLHIFESRYRQMVDDCLDQSGQIAMASFVSDRDPSNGSRPPIRPAVCIGEIIQHERLPAGRHNILLHGVCRARITEVVEPDSSRPYRLARLAPLESLESVEQTAPTLTGVRRRLEHILRGDRFQRMRSVGTVLKWFDSEDVPTMALLELIGFTLIKDHELKYRLLAEPDARRRAALIKGELCSLDRVIALADLQASDEWPKGMSWN